MTSSDKDSDTHSNRLKNILIVGDWVVDDYWVTGIHRSPTASRAGQAHYRALHSAESTVQEIGGAGRIAATLHRVMNDSEKFCTVLGVGLWHEADTDILKAMLNPECNKGQTPHRVSRRTINEVDGVTLFNLGEILPGDYSYGTTRVWRIYQHTGSKIGLLHRIDWELPVPSTQSAWVGDGTILENSSLHTFLEQQQIDAVVVKDICKGVISRDLISWLVLKLPGIPWFVSTKAWRPDWLESLQDADVRLLIVPQVAAQRAVRKGVLTCWVTESGRPSKGALEEIDKFGEQFSKSSRLIIVVLPKGVSLVARDWSRHSDKFKQEGLVQAKVEPRTLAIDISMASVFFPSLISHLIKRPDIEIDKLLRTSLHFTEEWMSFQVGRFEKPNDWNPVNEPLLQTNSIDDRSSFGSWHSFLWEQAKKEWSEAFSVYGIVRRDGRKYLELWRAMTEVAGYVCCVKSKQKVLQTLVRELASFKVDSKKQHRSYLLIASPGSGKTYLMSRLAKSLGLRFLSFNITQMIGRGDILDCFDTIVTSQAQNRDEPVLVFIDEINARLSNQRVYDAFLSPLEEGAYIRGGKTFHIDPCAWIFAGTEDLAAAGKGNQDKADKASDFRSRLTFDPLNFIIRRDEEEALGRIENVYLGVSLLRTSFPDVTKVSEKVLKAFHIFPVHLAVRELEHFVKSFVDIQYGEVLAKNVPTNWFRKYSVDLEPWEANAEGDRVEIKG